MAKREEIARLVRAELLNFINPVRLLTIQVNEKTGLVAGRFASGSLVFDFRFEPSGAVVYKPVRGSTEQAAAEGAADRGDSLIGVALAAAHQGLSAAVRLARLSKLKRSAQDNPLE